MEEEEEEEEEEKGEEEEGPAAHQPKLLRACAPMSPLPGLHLRQFAPLDGNTLVDMCSPERIAAARAQVCF